MPPAHNRWGVLSERLKPSQSVDLSNENEAKALCRAILRNGFKTARLKIASNVYRVWKGLKNV